MSEPAYSFPNFDTATNELAIGNRTTATIVRAWLEQATEVHKQLLYSEDSLEDNVRIDRFRVLPEELPRLVNAVQKARNSTTD